MGLSTKAPVCGVCLKSDILCQGCERKLKEGKISPKDIEVSRILFKLAHKHPGLDKVNFKRTIESGKFTVLVVGPGEIKLIVGRGGNIIKQLQRQLGTKIRVIEEGASPRKLAQDILTPAKVLGINILYTQGQEEYRIRVPSAHLRKLPASIDALQDLLAKLTNRNMKIVFE